MDKKNKNTLKLDMDWLSFASHELKTPLSTLKLNIDILQKTASDKDQKLIKIMDAEVTWMIRFVLDILDIKKSEQGRLNLSRHKWNRWFASIQSDIEQKVSLLGCTLKIAPAEQETEINIDPLYMRQALLNLVMNAVEHSPKTGKVEISWHGEGAPRALKVRVTDEGEGLNLKDKEKVFNPFYGERESSSRTVKGTGLGLTIVKKIAQAHGGAVRADNRADGAGAVFELTLPCVDTSGRV